MRTYDASPEAQERMANQFAALDLAAQGWTQRKIAAHFCVSVSTVNGWIQQALAINRERLSMKAEDLRILESEKLDRMEAGISQRSEAGDVHAIKARLTIMARRAAMNGLDKEPEAEQHGFEFLPREELRQRVADRINRLMAQQGQPALPVNTIIAGINSDDDVPRATQAAPIQSPVDVDHLLLLARPAVTNVPKEELEANQQPIDELSEDMEQASAGVDHDEQPEPEEPEVDEPEADYEEPAPKPKPAAGTPTFGFDQIIEQTEHLLPFLPGVRQ